MSATTTKPGMRGKSACWQISGSRDWVGGSGFWESICYMLCSCLLISHNGYRPKTSVILI
jgi:hypothetical protein